ncbi:MAG TPA: prepilin-type N-terminal cleavage/methylation domain-containing protein [Syntrophaceae bacterium]|nr:prepilin-type N-terminal cleavage/methylation domain-containing protein [Syntrophaceae bacterium]
MEKIDPRTGQKGFTLIELLVCIIIIGIIAAIAIPKYLSYRTRAFDVTAKQDIKQCYEISQVYFLKEPDGEVTQSILEENGLRLSDGVTLHIEDGTRDNLSLYTWYEPGGSKKYHCDASGNITEQDKT